MQGQGGAEKAWRDASLATYDFRAYMKSWLPRNILGTDRLRNELVLEGVGHLAEDFLIRADKLGMSQGLESRFPLLHEPFRSYALGLPSELKYKNGVLKWCAREAMRDVLPAEIIDKPKSGWGPPTGQWLEGKDKLVGPYGDRIKAMVVPGRVPAIDEILNISKATTRIKVTLALYYLMVWVEKEFT